MYKNKYGSKKYAKTLSSVEQTIQELHDGGRIDATAMKMFIEAGLYDLETRVSREIPTVASYVTDDVVPKGDAVSGEWSVDNVPAAEVPVVGNDGLESLEHDWTPLSPAVEKSVEGDEPVSTSSLQCLTPAASEDATSTEDKSVLETKGKLGVASTEGWGFLWCFECGEMVITVYGSKGVRWGQSKDGTEEMTRAIGIMDCGTCKAGYSDAQTVEQKTKESFEYIRFKPERMTGVEAERAAEAITGEKVAFATDREGGVLFVEIEKVTKGLRGKGEDRVVSVDMERFRAGATEGLVLGYLRGGIL